jgi:hypothetical protein
MFFVILAKRGWTRDLLATGSATLPTQLRGNLHENLTVKCIYHIHTYKKSKKKKPGAGHGPIQPTKGSAPGLGIEAIPHYNVKDKINYLNYPSLINKFSNYISSIYFNLYFPPKYNSWHPPKYIPPKSNS